MTEPARMRAGTTDRQAAVDQLSTHFADGRLDAAEFDQRVAAAYGSTYLDELPPLFADLPQNRPESPSWARGPAYGPRPLTGPGGDPFQRGGPWGPRGRRPGPPPPMRLALLVLLMFVMFWSIGAVTHGFFPFPLLWVVIGLVLLGKMRHRRHGREFRGPR